MMRAVPVTWVRLSLDLDDGASAARAACAPALPGLTVTSLQELGDPGRRRREVYELNKACSADIPGRGEFFTFEEYVPLRLEAPGTRADGFVLALDDDNPVGMCQLTCPPGRPWAFIEMTGVLRPYRRRGVATAMKLRALATARSWGCSEVRTVHHPGNAAIIAANRQLGFRDADFGG